MSEFFLHQSFKSILLAAKFLSTFQEHTSCDSRFSPSFFRKHTSCDSRFSPSFFRKHTSSSWRFSLSFFQEHASCDSRFFQPCNSTLLSTGVSLCLSFRSILLTTRVSSGFSETRFFRLAFLSTLQEHASDHCRTFLCCASAAQRPGLSCAATATHYL